jgi:hypothetical protein
MCCKTIPNFPTMHSTAIAQPHEPLLFTYFNNILLVLILGTVYVLFSSVLLDLKTVCYGVCFKYVATMVATLVTRFS